MTLFWLLFLFAFFAAAAAGMLMPLDGLGRRRLALALFGPLLIVFLLGWWAAERLRPGGRDA